MPCSDSSASLKIRLDTDERFVDFEFGKITCASPISAQTGLNVYCRFRKLHEILGLDFSVLVSALNLHASQEQQFILCLELEALKSGIAQYLGLDHPALDPQRCRVTSIEYADDYIDIYLIVLPPKDLPKILPCDSGE